jgi:hypothetical protein
MEQSQQKEYGIQQEGQKKSDNGHEHVCDGSTQQMKHCILRNSKNILMQNCRIEFNEYLIIGWGLRVRGTIANNGIAKLKDAEGQACGDGRSNFSASIKVFG